MWIQGADGKDAMDTMGHAVGTEGTGWRERAAGADIPRPREGEGDATPRAEATGAGTGRESVSSERGRGSGGEARYVVFVVALFIGPIFFVAGLASLAVGLSTGYATARWLGHAATATAQVTGSVDAGLVQGQERYCPLLTFDTADGTAVTSVPAGALQGDVCDTGRRLRHAADRAGGDAGGRALPARRAQRGPRG